jgi:predicted lipid-binding transport protein (Tim44 family)
MDGGSAFIEILVFGMVAAFLILRLRSVLGRRMGHERDQRPEGQTADASKSRRQDDKVVPLPGITRGNDPIARGIAEIQRADRNFDPDGFCVGARTAFELIVSAYASGDRDTLRGLTGNDVFELLNSAMTEREQRDETLESTLVRIRSSDIVGAEMRGSQALVTVKIVSEQINVTRDSEGHAISGHHSSIDTVTDIWTFMRDTKSPDPNWTLVEIQEPEETVAPEA